MTKPPPVRRRTENGTSQVAQLLFEELRAGPVPEDLTRIGIDPLLDIPNVMLGESGKICSFWEKTTYLAVKPFVASALTRRVRMTIVYACTLAAVNRLLDCRIVGELRPVIYRYAPEHAAEVAAETPLYGSACGR